MLLCPIRASERKSQNSGPCQTWTLMHSTSPVKHLTQPVLLCRHCAVCTCNNNQLQCRNQTLMQTPSCHASVSWSQSCLGLAMLWHVFCGMLAPTICPPSGVRHSTSQMQTQTCFWPTTPQSQTIGWAITQVGSSATCIASSHLQFWCSSHHSVSQSHQM